MSDSRCKEFCKLKSLIGCLNQPWMMALLRATAPTCGTGEVVGNQNVPYKLATLAFSVGVASCDVPLRLVKPQILLLPAVSSTRRQLQSLAAQTKESMHPINVYCSCPTGKNPIPPIYKVPTG